MTTEKLPHWDLRNVYPSLDSAELAADTAALASTLDEIDRNLAAWIAEPDTASTVSRLDTGVELFNRALLLSSTLRIFVESFVTTNSYDTAAAKKLSELEMVQVRLQQSTVRLQGWLRGLGKTLPEALKPAGGAGGATGPVGALARDHAFILLEAAEQGRYLMSEPEELLSAELSLTGANAWSKLQGTVTSQIVVDFELDGVTRPMPITAIVNLRTHPEEAVRHRAYDVEMREWHKVREPLAACMNGIKGVANTLWKRRGRMDCLHASLDQGRIDRATLEALLDAMRGSLPIFRRYFAAKARRIGKERLAWWDLFAPSGRASQTYSFSQARELVLETFGRFASDLRSFAEQAFARSWIDAEPRDGKRGGAFCAAVPRVKESRILCNFDGSLEQVSTIAHELGHGYHNHCAYAASRTELQQSTPMTLAETASILCEQIVNDALLARATDPQERLGILENALINDSQVIVDIYSRFLFEKEVLERRERSELSADDLCQIMERAQAAAYGEGLDERYRHRYMWTWKPHYYIPELSFYNYPYAFGLLFGTGLYARFLSQGAGFIPDYQKLLAGTGEAPAAELANRFGIDITRRTFWDGSLAIIARRVEDYCSIS
ncbi:MAG TPA: M3 family oligoendopeptidase [Spirochaetia bacterium]|nr:M3 family oligoendopeptidase [Spirochaetia bacterium]